MTDGEDFIIAHFKKIDLDLRKSKFSRFMDQKVTPDVLSFIAECVLNLDPSNKSFTVNDIWESDYFEKNTRAIFGKPSPKNENASSEYDKFIQQPLRMLYYARILNSEKKGTTNIYSIANKDILEYIAIREKNAFLFLFHYIIKVLIDSDIIDLFEKFRKTQSETDFDLLKSKFIRFIIGNTQINTDVEVRRIFPKILNVYSVYNQINGTVAGRMSKNTFVFSDLMYNDTNFRDIGKNKGLTRQEATVSDDVAETRKQYDIYIVEKAKNLIKKKYKFSEVNDKWNKGEAIHVHHIFPLSTFPQLGHFLENLIKLTADQHLYHAHEKGHTHTINRDYQCVCLLAKSKSVEQSLKQGEFFYSKNDFVYVVNTGLSSNLNATLDFVDIRNEINKIYNE